MFSSKTLTKIYLVALVLVCFSGVVAGGKIGNFFSNIFNKTIEVEEEIEEELVSLGITWDVILKNVVWFLVGGVAGIILMLSVWFAYKMMDPHPYLFNDGKLGPLEKKVLKKE
mmetsp:Transcript_10092/g.13152  ORF Transcript_10092/g.13152 Transcript_10092/m.13152 type:complete len:113 (-) Transcript_10092:49-387(-)